MITVVATTKIGRVAEGEEIKLPKYAARALVALNKAKFASKADDFRKKKKRQRKAMVAEDPDPVDQESYLRRDLQPEVTK